jgi:cytoskeletal protein RodZ
MSQGLRDMLANRRFAIPLIILLAFCFIGLILVGIVLILRPGAEDGNQPTAVAEITSTVTPTAEELVTFTPTPTETPTPRPTPTLVPIGTGGTSTTATSATGAEPTAAGAGTAVAQVTASTVSVPTTTPSVAATSGGQATATPTSETGELAQTGAGWGLILFAGAGLAMLAVVARRLRLAGG